MITINLFIGSRYPIDRQKLRQSAQQILEKKGINHAQLDILVVGKRKIQTLNEQKLKHQGPTDVLSFPHHDKGQLQEVPLPKKSPLIWEIL